MPNHGYGSHDLITSKEELRRWLRIGTAALRDLLDEHPEVKRRLEDGQGVLVCELARVLGLTLSGEGQAPKRRRRGGLPKRRAS